MIKYITLILIVFIIMLHPELVGAGQKLHNCLVDCYLVNVASKDSKIMDKQKPFYRKELTIERINKWENIKRNKNESFFVWLTREVVETNSWNYYKKTFISDDGRVIDHQRDSVSTSEGQAYAMRRALMMKDKRTFDKTYNWAKYNLKRKNDHLFAWLWGQKEPVMGEREIKYGIIDQNCASDGDIEIAVTLIFAYKIWDQPNYMQDAQKILNDIWNEETMEIHGERVITAGCDQQKKENVEINPSYFMLNSFRVFAKVDTEHDWQKLVDSSYRLTNWCIDHIPSGLPPDIFFINKNTGLITFDKDKSDFSYDAVRVFYRFYIDYTVNQDPRAIKLLSKSKIFINRWKKDKKFYTQYKQDGEVKDYNEAIGSIALLLPIIKMYDKNVAEEIYDNRIKAKYHFKGYWGDPMDYYAQNLVWFGNWLYLNEENIKLFKY